MKEELLKGLTEEQVAKIKACKNQEEMLAIAKEEGVELTDEQLAIVSGGDCGVSFLTCPNCNASADHIYTENRSDFLEGSRKAYRFCRCNDCGHTWRIG